MSEATFNHNSNATAPSVVQEISRKNHRLLFAISELERSFCPIALPVEITDSVDLLFFDYEKRETDWEKVLLDFRPTVLISSWSTPAIPEAYVRDPRCSLEYVCHIFGSVRMIVPRLFLEQGGAVTNWGNIVAAQVAEQALLLALGALRNMPNWRQFVRTQGTQIRNSASELGTRTLFGQSVGIHGFGRIARELVKLLKPFQLTLSAYSPGVPPEFMRAHDVQPAPSLKHLFASNHVLFECEALTPETERSVTAATLAALPDQAVFVNVGRGRIVDEEALRQEVASGRIRAALDVLIEEPLTTVSPFFKLPNVLLSPHIGGPTNDRYPACGANALKNLFRYLSGEPLHSLVTLADYDRST